MPRLSDSPRCAIPIDLAQRRLRHVTSISGRNFEPLRINGQSRPCNSYFTLHADAGAKAFYTSETVADTTNPTWRLLDHSKFKSHANLAASQFVVRVWAKPAEGPATASGGDEDDDSAGDGYLLLISWDVNLYVSMPSS